MRSRSVIASILLFLLVLSSIIPALAAQDATGPAVVTEYRGGSTRTGAMPGPAPTGPPSFRWRTEIDGISGATPGVGGGIVVVTNANELIALDQATGEERWRVDQPQSLSSPLIAGGLVYIGTGGEGLKALNAETGTEAWQFLSGIPASPDGGPADVFESSPTIAGDTLFIGGGFYGGLYALDPATGAERWRFDTHGWVMASPAVADGVVYITSNALFDADQTDPAPSALYAVDAVTGAERWTVPFAADIEMSWSTPLIDDGVVVVGICHFGDPALGIYIAVDAVTGAERWRVETTAPMWSESAATDGTRFFLPDGENQRLFAVDTVTGRAIWDIENARRFYGGPIVVEDILYLHDEGGDLFALDTATGDEHWRLAIGPGSGGEPSVVDGVIYATGGGLAYALTGAGDPDAMVLAGPPEPPVSGPGSDDTRYPAASSTHYGPDPGGYWIWEPIAEIGGTAPAAGPFPVVLYLSGCCGNDEYPTPDEVDPWMSHLARQGYVVIAPVYFAFTALEDSQARLREALVELTQPGHPAVDLDQFAVIAYSFGSVPAVLYAETAAAQGLPVPSALFITAPCANGYFCLGPPETMPVLPTGLKALVLAFRDDDLVGPDQPRQVYHALTSLPAEDRDFVLMTSDPHGQPLLIANHFTPFENLDAADWYGVWKLSTALLACAFTGDSCEYALGDTAEQRFMGTWSDGTPATELVISDDPGMPPTEPDEPATEATPAA